MNNNCDKCNLDSCNETWVVFRKDCVWTDWLRNEEECQLHIQLAVEENGYNINEFSYRLVKECDLDNITIYYEKYEREV